MAQNRVSPYSCRESGHTTALSLKGCNQIKRHVSFQPVLFRLRLIEFDFHIVIVYTKCMIVKLKLCYPSSEQGRTGGVKLRKKE
jgi:hypothetical protein